MSNRSRLDEARASLLISKAGGWQLQSLSKHYGFQQPLSVPEATWRDCLKAGVFAARGTPAVIFNFLTTMFGYLSEQATFDAEVESDNRLAIELLGVSPCAAENRLVSIEGKLYRTTYVSGGKLFLTTVSTLYWSGADLFSEYGGETVQVKFLPFVVEERDCVYRIYLDSGALQIPVTYLQEDSTQDQNAGEPPFGYLLDFFSATQEERFGGDAGPYPVYFADERVDSAFSRAIGPLLPAGVSLQVIPITWCSGTPMFGG